MILELIFGTYTVSDLDLAMAGPKSNGDRGQGGKVNNIGRLEMN